LRDVALELGRLHGYFVWQLSSCHRSGRRCRAGRGCEACLYSYLERVGAHAALRSDACGLRSMSISAAAAILRTRTSPTRSESMIASSPASGASWDAWTAAGCRGSRACPRTAPRALDQTGGGSLGALRMSCEIGSAAHAAGTPRVSSPSRADRHTVACSATRNTQQPRRSRAFADGRRGSARNSPATEAGSRHGCRDLIASASRLSLHGYVLHMALLCVRLLLNVDACSTQDLCPA